MTPFDIPLLIVLATAAAGGSVASGSGELLVDGFDREDGLSALGTRWQAFTDRVMGGRSDARADRVTLDGRACLRLRGNVSLANNGGFVQVALPLEGLDASDYAGIRLVVRGNGETGYYVHLRTADTELPWQYYQAAFGTDAAWTEVRIPFSAFTPESLRAPLDLTGLGRLGIVAAKRAFEADVAVAEVALYR